MKTCVVFLLSSVFSGVFDSLRQLLLSVDSQDVDVESVDSSDVAADDVNTYRLL
jgi:hypothetical protein